MHVSYKNGHLLSRRSNTNAFTLLFLNVSMASLTAPVGEQKEGEKPVYILQYRNQTPY